MRRWQLHLVGFLLCATYVGVLLANSDGIAMTRDESFYVDAANQYAAWFEQVFTDPSSGFERINIDRYWKVNREHPPLAKVSFALSKLANDRFALFDHPSSAYRFPGMLSAGLLLWLLFFWASEVRDIRAGFGAALSFALMPRVFYHAQLDCFDMPIALMVTWTAYAYWRSLKERTWIIWLGLIYGLALATKHNAWITPGILLIHWLWIRLDLLPLERKQNAWRSWIPWWLISMAVLGSSVFVLLWPWLWHDGWQRFTWYVRFHLHHTHYPTAYFGEILKAPPFPIAFPFVLTGFTLPISILLFAIIGIAIRFRSMMPFSFGRYAAADFRRTNILLAGHALAPIVVIALPSSPIFGGIKHMLTGYSFLALFAGLGVADLLDRLEENRSASAKKIIAFAVMFIVFLQPAIDVIRSRKVGLAYYSSLAGGTSGAAALGMNRQFWGFSHGELADFFNEAMPKGGRVWICDATYTSWAMWQKDGAIPNTIRAVSSLGSAQFALVHHEHHFEAVDKQIWSAWKTTQPIAVLTLDGVPLVSVYRRPSR